MVNRRLAVLISGVSMAYKDSIIVTPNVNFAATFCSIQGGDEGPASRRGRVLPVWTKSQLHPQFALIWMAPADRLGDFVVQHPPPPSTLSHFTPSVSLTLIVRSANSDGVAIM